MKANVNRAQTKRMTERESRRLKSIGWTETKKNKKIKVADREAKVRSDVEVETVFGQIKGNQGYRRFLLRGTAKASTEWGLLALGYNIKQIFRLNRDNTA